MRGAGTSIAGNAVGTGIVVDTLKHLNRVVSIDAEARTAVVQPGVVHADLQRAAAPYGLRFGPDPSTHTRCTIGGMIGNNACGSRALGYGRTVDNVVALDVAWAARAPATSRRSSAALVDQHLAHVRTSSASSAGRSAATRSSTCCPRTAATSTGSWSARRARSRWCARPPCGWSRTTADRHLVVLGYPSMAEAADAVPALLAATGGRDDRLRGSGRADRRPGPGRGSAVPELPRGAGWLFVEVAADAPTWSPRWSPRPARSATGWSPTAARGGRAVADPRGRRRPGRAEPVAPGVLRLGGRRRAARRGSAPGCATSTSC